MKKSELRQIIREEIQKLHESADGWNLIQGRPHMYRDKGKTWPEVYYSSSEKAIIARDNNSKRPSPAVETKDISLDGLKTLLQKHISQPLPSSDMLKQFIDNIKHSR